jgi:predicted esterase
VSHRFATQVSIGSYVSVPRSRPGAPLVIALHGWGMSDRRFLRWLRPGIEQGDLSWWVPRGILPGQVKSRVIGYGWYVYDGDQEAMRGSMDEARAYLLELARVARRTLRPKHITLLGFSQGGYLASYVALTRPDLFARLVCACARPKTEFLKDPATARDLRVLVQTGTRDDSVPADLIAQGVAPLRDAGLRIEERSYDTDHRLIPPMAEDAAEFAL